MLQSHTATQQWQSFEIRMRRRRVERCLLRASVALDAGVLDDVREALEEVQRLDPHEPEFHTLTGQLALAEARQAHAASAGAAVAVATPAPFAEVPLVQASLPEPARRESVIAEAVAIEEPRGGRAMSYAIAALLVMMSGAGGWFYVAGRASQTPPAIAGAERPALQRADAAAAGVAPTTAPAVVVKQTDVAATATGGASAADIPPLATETAVATSAPPATVTERPSALPAIDPPVTSSAASKALAPVVLPVERRRVPAIEPSPSLSEPAPAAPVTVTGADSVALTDTAVTLTPPGTIATPPAETAMPSPTPPAAAATSSQAPAQALASSQVDERGVRAALSRYEAAYSALDAAAASRIWPGVDQRALASAFQGLSSQTVSLGRCDVRVTGATAQADCKGMARWNPKVGGGPQTASRQWHFDLRSSGSDWIIARATVR